MTQITASNNMTVDYSYDRWRLIQELDGEPPTVIAEVQPEIGLRYNKYFATTRKLPANGQIPLVDISQVVLGWSYETDAWQLGITLSPMLSEERGSRWCEILRFVDPDLSVHEYDAKRVGQALADILNKPFMDMPPTQPPAPEPIPLPDLPITYGIWTMDTAMTSEGLTSRDGEVRLHRSSSWMYGKLRQVAWYGFWAVVYAWVSMATLNNDLALPNAGTLLPDPSILPYLGLGIVVLLLGMILYQLWIVAREPDNIIISPYERSVIARRGRNTRWKVNINSIQSIYVTEVVKKREKRPTVYHGEVNLHLVNGSFKTIILEDEKHSDTLLPTADTISSRQNGEGVVPLDSHSVETKLQAFALHIAECLDELPVWHDLRYK